MKLTSNQKRSIGTIASIATAGIIAVSSVATVSRNKIEIPYSINNVNQYIQELKVTPPDEESIDLVELYLGDGFIDRTLLPDGTLTSIPLVFSDIDNISCKCYKLNKQVGTIKFDKESNKCYYIKD